MEIEDVMNGPKAIQTIFFVGMLKEIAEKHIERVGMDDYERAAIEEAITKIDPALSNLIVEVLSPFGGDDAERIELGFARIYELVYACALLAGHTTWTPGLQSHIEKEQISQSQSRRAKLSVEKRAENAEAWEEHALNLAIESRKVDKSWSQDDVVTYVLEHWGKKVKKIGSARLKQRVSAWIKEGKMPDKVR